MKTFLSSTYADLIRHRMAASESIQRLGQQVGRMEVFGARPVEPSSACLTEIDECDLFVGIYAHRYGYVPEGSQASITEAEFDYAQAKSKPVFCFFVDEDHPWPPRMVEEEPGKSKLRAFKKKIGSELVRDTFTTPEDLAYKIAAGLGRYLSAINNTEPLPRTVVNQSNGHKEFFDKILSEIASLRREVQGQNELLKKVNHISELLQPSKGTNRVIQPINEILLADLEGCWRDSVTGSTFFIRLMSGELVVPYCYGGASELTAVAFDFRKRAESVLFARFKWLNSPIHGFVYLERIGSDRFSGGWWYSEDVPRQALDDLERFDPNLPRMNDLNLSRCPEQEEVPKWVKYVFSTPWNVFLKRLKVDA